MKKRLFITFLFLISQVLADSEMGCSISGLLQAPKSSILNDIEESNCTENRDDNHASVTKTAITNELMSISVLHETEKVLIERKILKSKYLCPPFCIEPMNIKGVLTVGELETLVFIDKLKEKKSRLLIDVRESVSYDKGTIPGALNLPFSMLQDENKYQEEVLKLLGANLSTQTPKQKWVFENAQSLLIFGASKISSEASSAINQLLKLGYPSTKLFYYRGGFESWQALGLTIY